MSKFIVYRPPGGIGAYQTFYTVPQGKIFLLRSVSGTQGMRVNNLDTFDAGNNVFDTPIKFSAGDYFSAWANVASAIVRVSGVEEDLSVQAGRNFY
jgi:hypothetical protein